MKKTMVVACVLASLLMMTLEAALAAYSPGWEVKLVRVDRGGVGYVEFYQPLEPHLSEPPVECARRDQYRRMLAFDLRTDGGRAVMSLVMAAFLAGKKVFAVGTGKCLLYTDNGDPATSHGIEDWNFGKIIN